MRRRRRISISRTVWKCRMTVDGIAGPEARNAEKRLATHLAGKWNREYSQMVYYVRVRMVITVVHASSFVAAVINNDPDAPSSPMGPP